MTQSRHMEILTEYLTDTAILAGFIGFGITLTDIDIVVKIMVGIATIVFIVHKTYFMIKDHKDKKKEADNDNDDE